MGRGGEIPRLKQKWLQNLKKKKMQYQISRKWHRLYRKKKSGPSNLIHVHVRSRSRKEGKEGNPKGGVLIPFVVIDVNWKNELYNMVPCWVIT